MIRLFRLSQGRQFSRCGCAFTQACGSEVWGFGSGVIGRVETLPFRSLPWWSGLHGASGDLMTRSGATDLGLNDEKGISRDLHYGKGACSVSKA